MEREGDAVVVVVAPQHDAEDKLVGGSYRACFPAPRAINKQKKEVILSTIFNTIHKTTYTPLIHCQPPLVL